MTTKARERKLARFAVRSATRDVKARRRDTIRMARRKVRALHRIHTPADVRALAGYVAELADNLQRAVDAWHSANDRARALGIKVKETVK